MIRNVLRRLIPFPIRSAFHRSTERLGWHYKLRYYWRKRKLGSQIYQQTAPTFSLAVINDKLPNSGPIVMTQHYDSASEVVSQFSDPAKRRQDIAGAEGFAPDDAVFDPATQLAELWSSAPLAGFIATFAYAHYTTPSILDIGCGPAHLFYFLRDLGVWDYVGIDANPFLIHFNPFLALYADHFRLLNLQEPIQLQSGDKPLHFDIVCSFEVLEHIREETVDRFIRTLCNHMHRNSVAFCTASLQDGFDVHVLVRGRDWWLDRFARFGLVSRPDEAELVRSIARNHPFNWLPFQSNIFALELREA